MMVRADPAGVYNLVDLQQRENFSARVGTVEEERIGVDKSN
jgi:hypothetical protein